MYVCRSPILILLCTKGFVLRLYSDQHLNFKATCTVTLDYNLHTLSMHKMLYSKNLLMCLYALLIYICIVTELEGSDLKKSLEELDSHGWHFDKQSQSQNRCLSPEDLVPLLKLQSKQSDKLYFMFINDYLLRLIDTEPILELIQIDVKSPSSENQPIIDCENTLIIAELINQTITDNSPQVCFYLTKLCNIAKWKST